jgi:uncharacterized phage infection (PIP) family protein YhgE
MGNLNLVFLIFATVTVINGLHRFNGPLLSPMTRFKQAFGQYMLDIASSRTQLSNGEGLEKLASGAVNRRNIKNLQREILYRVDEFSNELSPSTLKMINKLARVIGTNSEVTTLLQSLMKEVNQIESEERQFWRIWESKHDLAEKNYSWLCRGFDQARNELNAGQTGEY